MVLSDGTNRMAQKLINNRVSMLNTECQVTFSAPMYFYYLFHFGLTGNGRPVRLKIARTVSVIQTFCILGPVSLCTGSTVA